MNEFVIWHNPRCRKSKEALDLLEKNWNTPIVRLYLLETPSKLELKKVLSLLNIKPILLTRTKEKVFKEKNLKKDDADDIIVNALVESPILIERPIIIKNWNEAVIWRPVENLLSLL